MSDPTPNIPLLYQVLGYITSHPEEWDQSSWVTAQGKVLEDGNVCGTVACFAGWACVFSPEVKPLQLDVGLTSNMLYRGVEYELSEAARLALGLTTPQARALFGGENTLSDLAENVREIAHPNSKLMSPGALAEIEERKTWDVRISGIAASQSKIRQIETLLDDWLTNNRVKNIDGDYVQTAVDEA